METTMRCSYANAKYPKLGTIYGELRREEGEDLFFPDEKYHDLVYATMPGDAEGEGGAEPESGLWVAGAEVTVTPVK